MDGNTTVRPNAAVEVRFTWLDPEADGSLTLWALQDIPADSFITFFSSDADLRSTAVREIFDGPGLELALTSALYSRGVAAFAFDEFADHSHCNSSLLLVDEESGVASRDSTSGRRFALYSTRAIEAGEQIIARPPAWWSPA